MYINDAFARVGLDRSVLPWPSRRRKYPELLLLWCHGYALVHQHTSSFALSYRTVVSGRRWQWPVKLTRTNRVTWTWNRFLWAFQSVPPCHGLYEVQWLLHRWLQALFTDSLSLHSRCLLYSRRWLSTPLPLWRIWVSKLSDSFCCAAWEFRKKKICQTSFACWMKEWMDYWIKAEPEKKPSCLNISVYSQVSWTPHAFFWKQI